MTKFPVLTIALCLWCHPAQAQTAGRFTVGVSATMVRPSAPDLRPTTGVGVVLGRGSRPGWGITGALNWFEVDVEGAFAGIDGPLGTLRVRPLMAGPSYTFVHGRVATSLSLVGGPAFSRVRLDDSVRDRVTLVSGSRFEEEVGTFTLAVRPGASVSYALTRRVALTGFGGYLFNRPRFTLRTGGEESVTRWSADALVLSTGVAVSVF